MNLYLRMLYLLIASFFKPRLPIEHPENTLTLSVLPNDIDLNRHMNNGRYLTICDLSRVDMFIRTGLASTMMKEKWMPVISEHTMTYKRPLSLFKKYEVKMEITGWDDKAFHMTHTFICGERVLAQGTSKGCVVSKQGVIPPDEVIAKIKER
ncbi:acyl-CoA thioesterase [Neptunomonas japonica]|uniref:acyl-CoA thioesterase n=1 Tax=Neptunomonas japonica TaxID=417574 RepID=UPI00040A3854|nr:acyl-CoA thioesterase [Neptunomonas japonica]